MVDNLENELMALLIRCKAKKHNKARTQTLGQRVVTGEEKSRNKEQVNSINTFQLQKTPL